MENQPANPELAKSGRPRRRWFRWGLGFWILAWIASVCCYLEFGIHVKGLNGLTIGVAEGSIVCRVYQIVPSTQFHVYKCGGFWSKDWEKVQRLPNGVLGILANVRWEKEAGATIVVFPVAWLLWLWLAAGWFAEIRYWWIAHVKADGNYLVIPYALRRCRALIQYLWFMDVKVDENSPVTLDSLRRLIILTVALTGLGLATSYFIMQAQQAKETRECIMKIRNIQNAIRGWGGMNNRNFGSPIVWEKIIGDGRAFLSSEAVKCPSGGDYQLCQTLPPPGELAARCPHPEHQRYMLNKNTSDW